MMNTLATEYTLIKQISGAIAEYASNRMRSRIRYDKLSPNR